MKEDLKKQGYTEEEINLILDNINSISINNQPMGPEREDRSTLIKTKDELSMRSSNIMMGKNKEGIELENGEYLNASEVLGALEKTLSSTSENKQLICKKTGKKVTSEKLINDFCNEVNKGSKLLIGGKSSKITNQETAKISIKGKKSLETINKGILMLGNEGIKLPSGDYIFVGEINAALSKYMIANPVMTPKINPLGAEPAKITQSSEKMTDNSKNQVVKAKKTNKKKKIIAIIIGLTTLALATLGRCSEMPKLMEEKPELAYEIEHLLENETDDALIEQFQELNIKSTMIENNREAEQSIEEQLKDLKIGDKLYAEEGTKYYESSDYQYGGANKAGEFGSEIRNEGYYTLDGLSIIHGNRIIDVEYQEGQNVYDEIQEAKNKLGVDFEDLEIMCHMGDKISGWTNLTNFDLSKIKTMNLQEMMDEEEQAKRR